MRILFGIIFFHLPLIALASEPPSPFIDRVDACPFECCKYQTWNVEKDTQLFDKVNGKEKITLLKKGTKVEAITGEVHSVPNPVEIVFDHDLYNKGEKIYLLTYQGEGFYKTWDQGKVTSLETLDLFDNSGNPKKCSPPSKECWGEPRDSMHEEKRTWWIQFKLKNGKTGWSNQSKNFSGNDSCS